MKRAGLLALSAAAMVSASGSPAGAAVGRPFTVTGTAEQFPNGFSAAVNPSGTSAFAWTYKRKVRFRNRSASGRLGNAVTVAASGRTPLGPQVALDRSGNAAVVWAEHTTPSTYRFYAATRPRGGRFGTPQSMGPSFPDSSAGDIRYPLAGYDGSGNALIAWRRPGDLAVAWAAPGRRFGRAQRLSGSNPLAIAFRTDGSAAVLFSHLRGQILEAATAGPRGRFTTADSFQPVVPQRGFADIGASESPDTALLAVWREGYGGDEGVGPDPGPAHATIRQPGTAFGTEQIVSEPQTCGGAPVSDVLEVSGAMSTHREAVVTWQQCTAADPLARRTFARAWSAGGGWAPVVDLGGRGIYGGPAALAPDGQGSIGIAWLAEDRRIAFTALRPGGSFSAVQSLRTSGGASRTGARIAAAGDRVVLIWGAGDGYQAAVGTTAP